MDKRNVFWPIPNDAITANKTGNYGRTSDMRATMPTYLNGTTGRMPWPMKTSPTDG